MFGIGWQVYRERLPALVSVQRRRRIVLVGGIVAVVALAGLVILGLIFDDGSVPVAAAIVVAVLFASGIGLIGACFVPIGPKGWNVPPIPGIGWRTQEAIARYYRRSPPPLDPKHRDAVLDRMPETRDLLVRAAFRGYLLLGGWALAFLATVLLNVFTISTNDDIIGLSAVWILIPASGAVTAIGGIRTLGRQEQLRVEAEALPPVPPTPPARGRPGTPKGSKLSLPDD